MARNACIYKGSASGMSMFFKVLRNEVKAKTIGGLICEVELEKTKESLE